MHASSSELVVASTSLRLCDALCVGPYLYITSTSRPRLVRFYTSSKSTRHPRALATIHTPTVASLAFKRGFHPMHTRVLPQSRRPGTGAACLQISAFRQPRSLPPLIYQPVWEVLSPRLRSHFFARQARGVQYLSRRPFRRTRLLVHLKVRKPLPATRPTFLTYYHYAP